MPNVPVGTQDGRTLNFDDDLIKDKIVVLSFVCTSCKDICPLATARLGEAISIEPELNCLKSQPVACVSVANALLAPPRWGERQNG